MPCREVAQGVFLIDTLAGGIPGRVASYLVQAERSALVDVGHAASAETVVSTLQRVLSASFSSRFRVPPVDGEQGIDVGSGEGSDEASDTVGPRTRHQLIGET